jgi:hypothetical protein
MPTKHTRRARKPLAERVKWEQSEGKPEYISCSHGGVVFVIDGRWHKRWNLWSNDLRIDVNLKAKSANAAKAEALRIVQRAVLEAAEAWKD